MSLKQTPAHSTTAFNRTALMPDASDSYDGPDDCWSGFVFPILGQGLLEALRFRVPCRILSR